MRRQLLAILFSLATLGARGGALAQSSLVTSSSGLFEYHSAFWVNLHHLLYEQARALAGLDTNRAIVRQALGDTAGIEGLSDIDRAKWDGAIRYYRAHLASHDLLDRDMAAIKAALGDQQNAPTLAGVSNRGDERALGDSLREVLESAAGPYRMVWWPRHDRANREWIAAMRPRVAAHGAAMAREIARIFHIAWSDFLIRVDASAYSSWAGAYATIFPDRITVASMDSDYFGASGLETLFHESMHTLDDSVGAALSAAAKRAGKQLPPDLVHAMIFYTAGAVAKRELATEDPNYVPTAVRLGIWQRKDFPRHLPILERYWQPWIDDKTTFHAAIDSIVSALR